MDLRSKKISNGVYVVSSPDSFNGSGYKVSIFHMKWKCTTCGKTYDVFEETLFSRDSVDSDNPNTGQIILQNLDGQCPNFLLRVHEELTSKPLSKPKLTFQTFPNKQSWLRHLKDSYKKGFVVQSRTGDIGRDELTSKDDIDNLPFGGDIFSPEAEAQADKIEEIMKAKGSIGREDWEYIWGMR